eukprot:scaffold5935_cov48-Phaeocystis_antarctica.AAC.1
MLLPAATALWTVAAAVAGRPRRELQPGAATPPPVDLIGTLEQDPPWEQDANCTGALHLGERAWETDV